jgi:hypothetical protein
MPTKTPSKSTQKPKTKRPAKAAPEKAKKDEKATPRKPAPAAAKAQPAPQRAQAQKPHARPQPPTYIPRGLPMMEDEDDVLGVHGAGQGHGYGRCGGRPLGSELEQSVCNRLGQAGVAHSHTPRHFEVSIQDKQVAAYSPMIVLRGRGREGKSVVIEAAEDLKNPILPKIVAFRRQYGQEYYLILIAPDEVLDEVPLSTYDEACAKTDVNTLIARLAE